MTIETKIKALLAASDLTQTELARRLDTTPSALTQKLKRGSLTTPELERIAAAAGAEYEARFVLPDGTRI